MIFTKHNLTFRLLDVLKIQETDVKKTDQSRHFSALSLRMRSNAQIRYNGQTLAMESGSVSYFPPDFDYTRTAGYDDMIVIHFEVYNYSSHTVETYRTENYGALLPLFEEIHQIWATGGQDRNYLATACLYRIFAVLMKDCTLTERSEKRAVSEAKHLMQVEYGNAELSVRQIAKRLDLSEEYLRRVFKESEKTSPKKYLQDLRIRRASSLLTSGYYSVRQVAEKCGFMDEKYFSTAFKKSTGIRPSAYRYQYGEHEK